MPIRRPPLLASFVLAALAAGGWFFAVEGAAVAAGGQQSLLPLGPKNPSGLTLKIDGRGIDGNGYRPVIIKVSPTNGKPLKADRQLRVVLEISQYGAASTARVSQIIELPEGSTAVKATMLVPQSASWMNVKVETFEDGERLEDLSERYLRWPNSNSWLWTEARPTLLFIDSRTPSQAERESAIKAMATTGADPSPTYTLPDVRPVLSMFPDISGPAGVPAMKRGVRGAPVPSTPAAASGAQLSDSALLSLIGGRSRTEMLPPRELPSRWIELSQYDVAAISLADLQIMAKSHPGQLAALRDWVSTGPVLIVSGVGKDFGKLQEVEKLLDLPPVPSDETTTAEHLRWNAPRKQDDKGELRTRFDETGEAVSAEVISPEEGATVSSPEPRVKLTEAPFLIRAAKMGCVVAIAKEKPFPGTPREWAWLFNSVHDHYHWFRRTGFSMSRTNSDYWKFLIPGVGRAPVLSFLLLVSLFAVAIGPLNFWLLRRVRRLYLLLITVPAGALLVTLALAIFALVSDGLGVRLRVRSYTDLDQRTGRAAVWSRQSYYAGVAPSQGLEFPGDATVFPLACEPGTLSRDRTTLLVWDQGQRLRGGYLSSRTATQFMVCRATTSDAKLIVAEQADGKPPKVENRLAAAVQYVLLRDSRGDYFAGQSLADQTTKQLHAVDRETAAAALDKLNAAVKPAFPYQNFNPEQQNDNLFAGLGIRRYQMATSDSGAGDASMDSSLLEKNIDAALDPAKHPLSPGSYIAIVQRSPVVVTGVARAREEASFHVIRGRY